MITANIVVLNQFCLLVFIDFMVKNDAGPINFLCSYGLRLKTVVTGMEGNPIYWGTVSGGHFLSSKLGLH